MEEKLKSTLNRTPWSLILKACAFGASWLLLPFWAVFLVGLYFYFTPFFQPFKLLVPFVLTLAASLYIPQGFWFAVFLGILFFLILGIKNLIFVNRYENHQMMVFLLLFVIFFGAFSHFENWQKWFISIVSPAVALSFFFLFRELCDYCVERDRRKINLMAGLGAFLIWQAFIIALFLPLNYFYQTALLFLSSVILTDIFLEHLNGTLNKRKMLGDFSIFFTVTAVMLASANWGL
ncbi:MAG: hypothetical protein HY432_02725 [Candidatus Liptonbacteria bacterium]|nr:hypothetical protein [Candidatus Liptonbacteria bacterium]